MKAHRSMSNASYRPHPERPCHAIVHRHRTTTVQKIALYDSGPCSRPALVDLAGASGEVRGFCEAHARMALEGAVARDGETPPPGDRADYRSGRVLGCWSNYVWSLKQEVSGG